MTTSNKQCYRQHLGTMSSSQSCNGYSSEVWECRCKLPTVVITSKTTKNLRNVFWRCPNYKASSLYPTCNGFLCVLSDMLTITVICRGSTNVNTLNGLRLNYMTKGRIMNGLVRKILNMKLENQHLEEMNERKYSIIANMEKTIKRLGDENNAGKRYMSKMQQRKKTTIWCYVCAVCLFFISIFILSADIQIRFDKRMYLPYQDNLVIKNCVWTSDGVMWVLPI